MDDLAARSLAHWSEERRWEMDAFYRLATQDYRHLALSMDWRSWLERRAAETSHRTLRLLDVACGSGKFPTALVEHADVAGAAIDGVNVDLLDPSPFSVAEAKAQLRPPFQAAGEFVTTLQDFDVSNGPYDVVWAVHALYAVPSAALETGLRRFLEAIGPGGTGFIAHAARAGHYIRFQDVHLQGAEGEPYIAAETIVDTLTALGASIERRDIRYETTASENESAAVEGFLQRCLFDDTIGLPDMLSNPGTGPYLRACLKDGAWRFPQVVQLITVR